MKKLLIMMLVVFTTIVIARVDTAKAKAADIEIEFTIEADFVPFIDNYKVYTEVPGSGVFVHVATFEQSANFIYQITAIDLDPGRITNFYLAAVYGTDTNAIEDRSTAHPFKFTGKPVIIRINKN